MEKTIPIPTSEKERLEKLEYYQILDTEAEEMFDDLTELTAKILDVPVCLISLVDEDRQWFKSRFGMEDTETPRDISFCQYTIMGTETLEVNNALEDDRFKDSPLVAGNPNIRFYAGAPLMDEDGMALGALCAKDFVPRELDDEKRKFLKLISKTAMKLITLRREKLEAEKLSKVKDEFLSNMSHEIRTPLNAIIGFNDLLQKTPLNNEQKKFLDTLHVSSQNLKVIINDILDFSKLENGKIALEERPISIARLVDHVIKLQTHAAREKGLKLLSSIDFDLPEFVMGDETRLIQILINLVGNAIKFTNEGTIELKVLSQQASDNRVSVSFSVKDTGIGIPKDKLKVIFERFSQAENSTTRLYGGTGLGLNIVEMLVRLQNGKITVNSEQGKGSEFVVDIPFVIANDPETTAFVHSTNQEPDPNLFKDAGILLVEDNVHNQFLAKTYFNRWGGAIEIAENGQKAVDLIKTNDYHVVLMDLQMPVMNGFDATSIIRDQLKMKIPIIGCSAHSLNSDREKCLKAGMDDYIAKPYTEEELIQTTLRYYLESQSKKDKKSEVKSKSPNPIDDFEGILKAKKEEYGEGIIDELVQLFLSNIADKTDILKKALNEENIQGIMEQSHYLSGSLGSLGFEIGLELCREAEGAAEEGHAEDAKLRAKEIIDYLEIALKELSRL